MLGVDFVPAYVYPLILTVGLILALFIVQVIFFALVVPSLH